MPNEIEPSGTDWDRASELADWERQATGLVQHLIQTDFGDEAPEKTIRLTYMGNGRFQDLTPNVLGGEGAEELRDRQVTAWRLRYPDLKGIEIAPGEAGLDSDQTIQIDGENAGEWLRGRMFVRPGVPAAVMLAYGAMWCQGFQIGKERAKRSTRNQLRRELHEILDFALENMPSIRGTPEEHEDLNLDLRGNILDRLKGVRDELKGDTYHLDLPPFTVEVEDDEDDTPAPRESPNPFDMATGLASVPTGPVTRGNLRGISGEGKWIEDSFGRPVYRYTIEGPPWSGNAQLSLKEAIEAETAWKMLREGKGDDRPAQFHADAVTLYLLFLAYMSDQAPKNRPGQDNQFRIPGDKAFRILNLPANWDRQKKVRYIHSLNSYLNSFQIQLKHVTYNGDRKRTEAISPAQLWDTFLRGVEESDLYGNTRQLDFWIEGREGAWADLFVHDSDTWTPWGSLPIRVLEDIDGRNKYTRLILFHALILFRVEKGTVKRTADHLLKWCRINPDELKRQTAYRRRRTILNALDELKNQGFDIEDERLRVKGTSLSDWQGLPVYFHPTDEIVEACPQIKAPEGKSAEPRAEIWTGRRVRALRKHIGDNQSEFGRRLPNREGGIGVKQPRVSTIENGPHNLTNRQERKLNELAEEFGFEG